jgi:D-glycero-D-manno-heptose 1,7-bisphosphate phosphatase
VTQRFVFLDRDGTLVRDRGYTHRLEDYELLPGVVGALRRLSDAGFGLAIVTNQSGIGRGLFTLEDYERFERHLEQDLAEQGVSIAGSFFCPHAPGVGCRCRKPAPELFERAARVLGADLGRSYAIGDARRDAEAALAAGCAGAVWLVTDPPDDLPPRTQARPDLEAAATSLLTHPWERGRSSKRQDPEA